jgi:hypothetical protein
MFRITGGQVAITDPFTDSLATTIKSGKYPTMWHSVLLLKKDQEMNRIKRLSDVLKDGGKVFTGNIQSK